jgi:hypothetical protein
MRKICIFIGIIGTFFSCGQNLTEKGKTLCKSLDIDKNVAVEIKTESKSVIEQLRFSNSFFYHLIQKLDQIQRKC